MPASPNEAPNSVQWPPIIFVMCAAAALGLTFVAPLPLTGIFGNAPTRLGGLLIIVAGFAINIWAIVTMRRAGTNILPNKVADKLVDDGPFAHSRNPIYLGNTVMLAGGTLAFSTAWFLLAAVANAAAVHYLAIAREEAHMHAKFGKAWTDYTSRVGRWFGRT